MRADFAKVVTERPRYGSHSRNGFDLKGRKKEDCLHEDFSKKSEPMSMGRGTKRFTDVLGPLRKFLNKQVGRPWDKIYSECCQRLNRGNTNEAHVLEDHLLTDVETKVVYHLEGKKKVPYTTEGRKVTSWGRHERFYVCPNSGLLKVAPREYWHKFKPAPPQFVTVNKKHYKKDDDGIWYEITLITVTWKEWEGLREYDVFAKCIVGGNRWDHSNYYGKNFTYCKEKRQLNKREIHKLKLNETK